jgi:hypothetical protein
MGIWSDFSFDVLYPYMLSLASNDSAIIYPYNNHTVPALTYDACVARVGGNPGAYSRQDVYDRVLLWRVPLIALWATTTLPALGWRTKVFTLLHLVADPIDTLWSLFYKLDLAKCTAKWSIATDNDATSKILRFTFRDKPQNEDELNEIRTIMGQWPQDMQELDLEHRGVDRYVRDAIASIITAYDEWGYGAEALRAIEHAL